MTVIVGQILSLVRSSQNFHVISVVKLELEGLRDSFLFMLIHFIFPHPSILQSSLSLVHIRQVHFGRQQLFVGLNPLCYMSAIMKNAIFNRVLWKRQKDVCTIPDTPTVSDQ